jgi:hypothetical protein
MCWVPSELFEKRPARAGDKVDAVWNITNEKHVAETEKSEN